MVCQEQTHLMILSKEGFDKIIGSFQQQNTRDKLDFLKSFQFLDSLPTSQLMSLLHYFKINSFTQKTVLYNQGDKVTDIYFIKSGEVQVLKSVLIEDEEYHQSQREKETSNRLYEMNLQLKNKIKTKKNIMVPIKLLGPGQCFGEEEVIEDLEKRTHKVIVTQHAEIYNISKDYVMASLKSQKGLNILQKQKQVKQSWIQERETFITQKKAENNNKMKEELQMIEKKKQTKLDYTEMSENIKYQQLMLSTQRLGEKQSPSSPFRNSIFGLKINQKKIRHQNSNSDSPCSPSFSPSNQFYPDIDELQSFQPLELDSQKANSKNQSSNEVSTNKKSNQQGFLTSRNSSDNRELTSQHKIQSPISVLSNKLSLFQEIQELKQQSNQNINLNLQDQPIQSEQDIQQISNQLNQKIIDKQSPKLLPKISLFDYKTPSLELEFKSHSQFIDMQEMTTRSKADNFTILIKNKNQISGRKSQFEKQEIQIDLFKDVKKRNKMAQSQIAFTPQKKSEFSNQKDLQNTQQYSYLKDQKLQQDNDQQNSQKLQQLRSKSQENLQKKRNMTNSFYNSSLNTSIIQSMVRSKASSVNESAQLLSTKQINTKDVRQINKDINLNILNHTGFSAMNINIGNNKSVLYSTSQAIQQSIKKGSVVTLLNQQPSHFVASKHITEFTRDIRNKQILNGQKPQNKIKRKNASSLPSKNAFISQIDFTGVVQDQNIISPQIPAKSASREFEDLDLSNINDKNTENKYTCVNESQFEQYKQNPRKQYNQIYNSKNSENKNKVKDSDIFYSRNYILQKSLNQDEVLTPFDMSFNEQTNLNDLKILHDSNEDDTQFKLNSKYDQNQEKNQSDNLRKIENKVRSRAQTQGKTDFNAHSSSQNYTFGSMYNNIESNVREMRTQSQSQPNSSQIIKFERRSSNYQKLGESMILNSQSNSILNNESNYRLANSCLMKKNSTDSQNEQLLQNTSPFIQQIESRKTSITFNDIKKSMKKTFNLEKLVQNEAEKKFTTRLANLQNSQVQQQKPFNQKLSEAKMRSNSPGNIINPLNFANSSKNLSLQNSKLRDKHNQRIIDISNQKKRINQNVQIAKLFEQNILSVDSTPSQKLHRKIFRQSSQNAHIDKIQIAQIKQKDFQVESAQKYS